MKALIAVTLGCIIGAATAAADTHACNAPDVESVQHYLKAQGDAIRALRALNLEQQRTIDDLKRRLWNTMNRQQA